MTNIEVLKNMLSAGEFDRVFIDKMGCADVSQARNRALSVTAGFEAEFGDADCALFSSPGRTELGGNHTDHQRGSVLAASINADMLCCAALSGDKTATVFSESFGKITVDLTDLSPRESEIGSAAALIRGVAACFENRGYSVGGINAYIASDVPIGSGISSSAAFEVLLGTVFSEFFADGKWSALDIAKAGLFAENVHFGKPCGLMDQTACAHGGIVAVDFCDPQDPLVQEISYDFSEKGYALCIINTGGSHDDLTEDYAAITSEMKDVAKVFGKEFLSELSRENVLSNAREIRTKCGDRAYLRAVNYFEEDERAKLMAQALKNDDFGTYLRLVNRSGQCSFMYLQNISPKGDGKSQPVAAALLAADISLGGKGAFRVHGGGFAGTIQAYVPLDMLDKFVHDMDTAVFSGCCRVLNVRKRGAMMLSI